MDKQELFSFFVRKGLTAAGSALATHGFLCTAACANGTTVEQFVGAGMTVAGVTWSWWRERGQALVAAKLTELRQHIRAIPVPSVVPANVSAAIAAAKTAAAVPVTVERK